MSKKSGDTCALKIEANAAPISAESVQALADGLASIMAAGFRSHADQSTIQAAIRAFGDLAAKVLIDGTNISNCALQAGSAK